MKKEDVDKMAADHIANISESDKIKELKREIYILKKTMEEHGIEEFSVINDIEYICYKTIEDLKNIADSIGFTQDDAKILDIVHKNLRQARGELEIKEPKSKKATVGELLKIVNKSEKK